MERKGGERFQAIRIKLTKHSSSSSRSKLSIAPHLQLSYKSPIPFTLPIQVRQHLHFRSSRLVLLRDSLFSPDSVKMMSTEAARNVVGIIGNVISFGLFLSPVPTFVKIWRKKAVEQFSPVPYLVTLLNCMLWVFYGLPIVHPHSILVVTINGTGIVLEGAYLTIFFLYAPKDLRLKVLKILAGEVAFMAVVVSVVLAVGHTHEKRSLIVGILCVVFGTCMYASPLTVMKMVITTKSVEYMPFWLSLAGFLNGVCWTSYALLKFDIFIAIPNGLGALFGFLQLLLYACYCRCNPAVELQNEEAKKRQEIEMA